VIKYDGSVGDYVTIHGRSPAMKHADGGQRLEKKKAGEDDLGDLKVLLEEQSSRVNSLAARVDALLAYETEVLAMISALSEQSRRSNEDLLSSLYEIQAAQTLQQLSGVEAPDQIAYRQLVGRIRKAVRTSVPADGSVLVISRGDPELLKLYGRRGSHFPQSGGGEYSGHYPIDSTAAIVQMETLRARGAEYLLVPSTALWWLDHYRQFSEHLETRYEQLYREEGTCVIFSLRPEEGRAGTGAWIRFQEVLSEHESRFRSEPAVLDWHTGLRISEYLTTSTVFTPPGHSDSLPYLDASADIVAVLSPTPHVLAESRRVARNAVVTFTRGGGTGEVDLAFSVEWQNGSACALASASIIVPTYENFEYTRTCVVTLLETLPRDFSGEILIVDDHSSSATHQRLQDLAERDPCLRILRNPENVGFLTSCNRAARVATGDILIFLNNDTLLLPGWFLPLIKVLRDVPDAGAVGGKLVFPDGRLQEAGGIVFSDGSAAHFGRDDYDLNAPLFSYFREVDYCSAALLATPRALFEELDGFDERYRPAYYEDTDYCFKVREKGYRVYFQPESVIVHLEGASSGTDLTRGVKRHQVLNQGKFVSRWEQALKSQPARPHYSDVAGWQALADRSGCSRSVAP